MADDGRQPGSERVAETPLFPLNTVLFPGGPLQLRIFEPRYLDMIGRCLKSNVQFGVVAIRRGTDVGAAEFHTIGTFARITDWFGQSAGVLGLTAVGTGRFEVGDVRRQRDGLYVGMARSLAAAAPTPLAEEHAWAASLLETLLGRVAHQFDLSARKLGDAGWVSFRLAELLPLTLASKQAILEIDNPHERFGRLAEVAVKIRDTQH